MSLERAFAKKQGFTLLELLIVVAILAILAVIVAFVLNPAEQLRKGRDVQRLSDLATLKSTLGVYTTTVSGANLDLDVGGARCIDESGVTYNIFVSTSAAPALTGVSVSGYTTYTARTSATPTLIDGTGWLPVNLTAITGGSPISNLPLDPANSSSGTEYYYAYACVTAQKTTAPCSVSNPCPAVSYETSANLESTEFTSGASNKEDKDGGDDANAYEIGTELRALPPAVY